MSQRVITRASNRIQVVWEHSLPPIPASVEEKPLALSEALKEEHHLPLQRCIHRLEELVGLQHVKEFIQEIYAWLEVNRYRAAAGLSAEQQVLHMVFTGNPGTGKTTVARMMSEMMKEMEVLTEGHLIEAERADLVGEYIGHTAQKTREQVKRAQGGILFIDEAYSLIRGGEQDFGKEAIDTLVKAMEDHHNHFILILAGYSDEMKRFMNANPGLPSRFPLQLHFPDFTVGELVQIAEEMVNRREYILARAAKEKLATMIYRRKEGGRLSFGNARTVRNLVEQAIRQQAVRLLQERDPSRDTLMMILPEDIVE
ncbi:AAA family ATPase [Mechercharimyces sp. CAU 1602]|uniref:AAA family ATPase n=1 Tax=Mechercharimyces sp. CAU 1602 TaxID=2973933 RepID=UPI00216177D3|nr:AAA family ATPase [Mechercharimyces sp. CAU 1602]MCS1351205.1 AAA family ATPase [Mechercharimyces sp. CAU 1602]